MITYILTIRSKTNDIPLLNGNVNQVSRNKIKLILKQNVNQITAKFTTKHRELFD